MPDRAAEAVRAAALRFEPGIDGLAPLLDAIGDATLVLIGEASHGTHEFFRIRADLTAALKERSGFNLVAAEADWPDRVSRESLGTAGAKPLFPRQAFRPGRRRHPRRRDDGAAPARTVVARARRTSRNLSDGSVR